LVRGSDSPPISLSHSRHTWQRDLSMSTYLCTVIGQRLWLSTNQLVSLKAHMTERSEHEHLFMHSNWSEALALHQSACLTRGTHDRERCACTIVHNSVHCYQPEALSLHQSACLTKGTHDRRTIVHALSLVRGYSSPPISMSHSRNTWQRDLRMRNSLFVKRVTPIDSITGIKHVIVALYKRLCFQLWSCFELPRAPLVAKPCLASERGLTQGPKGSCLIRKKPVQKSPFK
jgi:hypothetical protein